MDKVVYVFRRKRTERLHLHKQGLGPDEMLYGMNHIADQHFAVDFIEGDSGVPTWTKKLVKRLERSLFADPVGMGFALDMVLENLSRLQQADAIVTTVDSCGLPVALLKRVGIIKGSLIYISQGLSDRVELLVHRPLLHRLYKAFYSWLLLSCQSLLTLGTGAAEHLMMTLNLRGKQVQVLPFGVDKEFWRPADPGTPVGDYILSVGSDPARDYDTLIQAIGDRKLKIVTRLPVNIPDRFKQIEVQTDISDIELRALYQGARFVVTPLKDVTQPSGQSATLQAMACGKAVIVTRTRGLWEPHIIKHFESVYLVPPGDAKSLDQAIQELDESPALVEKLSRAALSLVRNRYNSIRFGSSLQAIIQARHMPDIRSINFAELRESSISRHVNEEIVSLINSSTLGLETLRFISTLIDLVQPRFILEYGSGLSTLLFSKQLANAGDAIVYSIDNSEFYLNKTRESLSGQSNVKLFCCPIRPYQHKFKRFLTYDVSYLQHLPQGRAPDMILIDGPLGHRYGREAALYQVAPFISPETLILLDDANREPEQTAIANWHKVWGDALDIVHFPDLKKGLAILQIKRPLQQIRFPFSAREIRDSWQATRRMQREDWNGLSQ